MNAEIFAFLQNPHQYDCCRMVTIDKKKTQEEEETNIIMNPRLQNDRVFFRLLSASSLLYFHLAASLLVCSFPLF